MQRQCVMQHTTDSVNVLSTFDSLFQEFGGKSVGTCIRLHVEGRLKAAFALAERG